MAIKTIKINGEDFTSYFTPVGYNVSYLRPTGENKGTMLDGSKNVDALRKPDGEIAEKSIITATCMPLNEQQLQKILAAVSAEYLNVEYFEPKIAGYRTAVMIPDPPKQKYVGTGVNQVDYWAGTVITLTER